MLENILQILRLLNMDSELLDKTKELKNQFKHYIKGKNQSQKQKHNWRKNRNAYMRGIHSYFRRKDVNKEDTLGFLNTLLSKNESLSQTSIYDVVNFLVILEHEVFFENRLFSSLLENVRQEIFLVELFSDMSTLKTSLLEENVLTSGLLDFIGFVVEVINE